MLIRLANETDAAACQRIYAPIVRDTAISFEEAIPTDDEMARRIGTTLAFFPWLVCCDGDAKGPVVAYAYAGPHRTRAAYRWTVESAIYIATEHRGRGIGRRLYETLFEILRRQGYRMVVAGATLPNPASVALHERLGFKTVGVFQNIGFKFNQWYDTRWFEYDLKTKHAPREPIPLPDLLKTGKLDDLLNPAR
ncbi:MAG: N-acetyltransferase [Phycisphaerales bacterium]|nr:N-acetyltransferase [Phycisphaerales bacterium]